MDCKVRFRCEYTIEWPTDKLKIQGLRSVFNSDGKTVSHRENMVINTTITKFLEFCTICIASEQGTRKDIDLSASNIRFGRETFDDRYFYCDKLQIAVGEVYLMYEILKRKVNVRKLKMYKLNQEYFIFVAKERYLFISDKSLLNVGFFRYDTFGMANFTVGDKISKGQYGYDTSVPIGQIQKAWMEKGACHPYVNLQYRDMVVNMSLAEWNRLRIILNDIDFDFEL